MQEEKHKRQRPIKMVISAATLHEAYRIGTCFGPRFVGK
jgi:hypothetical protein